VQTEEPSFLPENLAALARSDPALAANIAQSSSNPALAFRRAKNGATVPVVRGSSGDQPFHSLVDPGKEAERVVLSLEESGYLVCLGLGGGYLAAAFLHRPDAADVLIVEKDHSTLRTLLSNIPLSTILSERRLRVTVGADHIRDIVLSSYLPAICGNLVSVPVRPWRNAEKEFFDRAALELRRAVEEARADYAVQARFGKRWFTNMILNLPAAELAAAPLIQGGLAHITAAGPSLEGSLPEIAHRDPGSIIVATDTSLPALLRNGLRPEIVVSLDCQLYSYHHFLTGIPKGTSVFYDLASPPFLVRRTGVRSQFFASAHPLSRFISANWRRFPVVDTTGGNVTYAAVSLARALGFQRLRIHGADFGYPRAKPYARGTYLYDYFQGRQQRFTPVESSLCAFVLGLPGLTKSGSGDGAFYSTPVLRDYGARMERLLGETSVDSQTRVFEPTSAQSTWREFLRRYTDAVRELPLPSSPLGVYFPRLRSEQRELWATLLPIAATVLRETRGWESRATCLELSRQWALGRLTRLLSTDAHKL